MISWSQIINVRQKKSMHGFLYSAQCKWRNGENNRTLTLTLFLTLNLTLKLTVKALRHLHCAEYR